jgi:hypothetical protein
MEFVAEYKEWELMTKLLWLLKREEDKMVLNMFHRFSE